MGVYAVAGVTGKVGSVVARELLARDEQVRAIVRDPAGGAAWSARGAEVVVGALEDRSFLVRAFEGVAGCFVLLPEDPFAADFRGTRRAMAEAIAEAVRESRVPHVVVLSAVAACVPEGNGPAGDLHYLERLVRSAAAKWTIVRASWFQENVGAVVSAARHAGIYPNLMGSADVSFPTVATRDVGRVVAALLASPPATSEVVDVVGPAYSPRELAAALGDGLGRTLQIIDVPPPARVGALVQAGLPASFAAEVAELYECFDAGRARPQGDRLIAGTTTIAEVVPGLLQ